MRLSTYRWHGDWRIDFGWSLETEDEGNVREPDSWRHDE